MNEHQKAFHDCKDGVGIVSFNGVTFVFVGHGWKAFNTGTEEYLCFVPHGEDTNDFGELYDDFEEVMRMEHNRELGIPSAEAVFTLH